jgi:hypothetical protein
MCSESTAAQGTFVNFEREGALKVTAECARNPLLRRENAILKAELTNDLTDALADRYERRNSHRHTGCLKHQAQGDKVLRGV